MSYLNVFRTASFKQDTPKHWFMDSVKDLDEIGAFRKVVFTLISVWEKTLVSWREANFMHFQLKIFF